MCVCVGGGGGAVQNTLFKESLKHGWGAYQPIRHDPELVVACRGYKGGLTFVHTSYLDQIVGSAQIKLLLRNVAPCNSSIAVLLQLYCSRDKGKRLLEVDCEFKKSVVNARPQSSILLGHKLETGSRWGC